MFAAGAIPTYGLNRVTRILNERLALNAVLHAFFLAPDAAQGGLRDDFAVADAAELQAEVAPLDEVALAGVVGLRVSVADAAELQAEVAPLDEVALAGVVGLRVSVADAAELQAEMAPLGEVAVAGAVGLRLSVPDEAVVRAAAAGSFSAEGGLVVEGEVKRAWFLHAKLAALDEREL